MTTVFFRQRLFVSTLVLSALLLVSCGGRGNVSPYSGSPDTPSVRRQGTVTAAKTLPPMGNVRAGSDLVGTPRGHVSGGYSEALLPVLTMVADRIAAYEDKMQAWDAAFSGETETILLDDDLQARVASCRSRLREILDGYNQLHEDLISESIDSVRDAAVPEQVYSVERADIDFLESECQIVLANTHTSGSWLVDNQARLADETEQAIRDALAAGEYQEVVRLYEAFPGDRVELLSFESRNAYGLALLRTGRESEAGTYLQDLLRTVRQEDTISREFQLMRLIADIQFGLEEYPAAFNRYVDIINRYAGFGDVVDWARSQQEMISARTSRRVEVKSYSDLMRAWLVYDPARDGYKPALLAQRFVRSFPDSMVLSTVNRILLESRDRADAWFAGIVQRLDQLENEKKYSEAVRLIEKLPVLDMPDERREYVRSRADELISAQFREAEHERLAREATLQETWEKGQQFLRTREYDQAIEVLTGLLGTDYDKMARDQINEAANLAARENRRRAAELFVRSGRVKDRDARVRLLFESRQLLENILARYPQSDLVDKVRKNLDRIEREIRSIDPELLAGSPVTGVGQDAEEDKPAAPRTMHSMSVGELQVLPAADNGSGSGEVPAVKSVEE